MHNTVSPQGALERFPQTLGNMMNTFCLNSQKDLDDGIYMPLYAVREAFEESLGFSHFELVLDTLWEVPFDRKHGFVKILLLVF
jgi:hypothetical protein